MGQLLLQHHTSHPRCPQITPRVKVSHVSCGCDSVWLHCRNRTAHSLRPYTHDLNRTFCCLHLPLGSSYSFFCSKAWLIITACTVPTLHTPCVRSPPREIDSDEPVWVKLELQRWMAKPHWLNQYGTHTNCLQTNAKQSVCDILIWRWVKRLDGKTQKCWFRYFHNVLYNNLCNPTALWWIVCLRSF